MAGAYSFVAQAYSAYLGSIPRRAGFPALFSIYFGYLIYFQSYVTPYIVYTVLGTTTSIVRIS